MNKTDWLMIAVGDHIQPIQLQKTLFRFAMESKVPKGEQYHFVPYNWGPCSFEIYNDLGRLREQSLIEAIPSNRGWNSYRLSKAGRQRAAVLRQRANPKLVGALDKMKTWVMSRDFETLLRDVYKKYPRYATESLFIK